MSPYTFAPTLAGLEVEPSARPPTPDRDGYKRSFWLGFAALTAGGAGLGLMLVTKREWVGGVWFGLATLLALAGVYRALVALHRSALQVAQVEARPLLFGLLALVVNLTLTAVGALATLLSTVAFTRGRQLRRFGRPLLPPLAPDQHEPIISSVERVDVPPGQRAALAARWRENGRTEYASVAAFARLSLDLIALGAPRALVEAAHADARDELRRTTLCFDLARQLDGRALAPGRFPEAASARTLPSSRTLALALLAVDSLVDGALNEGVSAYVVATLARRCPEPAIRAVLREIARDEARHAAHGWSVVAYCIAEGGAPVVEALRGAVRALPTELRAGADAAAHDGSWEGFGIPGRALEAEAMRRTRTRLVHRLTRLSERAGVARSAA